MEAHFRNVLGAFALAIADRLDEDAAAHGRTGLEQSALLLVQTRPGMSQQDLQRRLGLSQPGTTRLIDRLEARGLLMRGAGPDDRTHALRLSAAGRLQARAAAKRRHQLLARAVAAVEPGTRQAVVGSVDAMLRALVTATGSPYRTCRLCDQRACIANDLRCPVEQARLMGV